MFNIKMAMTQGVHQYLRGKEGFTRGKISADICAEKCASETVYKVTNNKYYIKMLKLAQFRHRCLC
jgi:hypothetical protein